MISMRIPQKVSTNAIYAGMHWRKRQTLADAYHRALLPFKNQRYLLPVHLVFTFTFRTKILDCSNCSMMVKMLEDGMVKQHIIPDDTPKYVKAISIQVRKGDQDEVMIETL